jgi:hypothetical protein
MYQYDGDTNPEAGEEDKGLHYDRGIIFEEPDLSVINQEMFFADYALYIQSHTITQTLAYLANLYSISTTMCQTIIDIFAAS